MIKSFRYSRKGGYDTAEVDVYVRSLEDAQARSKEEIASLKAQLDEKETEIKAFKQRQSLIVKTIMNAVQKAEQIEKLTKQKYAFDMAQLKAFHERWLVYYKKLLARFPLDAEILGLKTFNDSMTRILSGNNIAEQMNEAEEQFKKETQRLKKKKIGYIEVDADDEDDEEDDELLDFKPEERIREMLRNQAEKELEKDVKKPKGKATAKKPQAKLQSNAGGSKTPIAASQAGQESADSGFNFEEALNPSQELSDILKDLGFEE